jgi:hypothetical protein
MRIWTRLRRAFFDFTHRLQWGRRAERMLRVALTETTTDADFYALLHRMVIEDDPLRVDSQWSLLITQLSEYREPGEDWRPAAQRLADALPGLYGYVSDYPRMISPAPKVTRQR